MSTRHNRTFSMVALILAFGLVTGACSSDDRGDAPQSTTANPAPPPSGTQPPVTTFPDLAPVFTQVQADGMTLTVGPIVIRGVAVSSADTWLLAGAEFDAQAGTRVAVAWEGELADVFSSTLLPTIGDDPEGAVADVTTIGEDVFAAGSGRRDGATVPVAWRHDPPGRNWQLIELPADAQGTALEIAGWDRLIAVVVESSAAKSLWISDDLGATWTVAPAFPLAEVGVTDLAVMGDLVVVSGAEPDTDHLVATTDGETYASTLLPSGQVTSLATDGTIVVAAGAVGDESDFPAVRTSPDGATWTTSTDFTGDVQPAQLVDVTSDINGFVTVSAVDVATSPDGTAWEVVAGPPIPARFVARNDDEIMVVGGGDVSVPGRDGWDITRIGLTGAAAPSATSVAEMGGVFVVAGGSPAVSNPVWISPTQGDWTLADAGLPLAALAATADMFVGLTQDETGLSVVASRDGLVWSPLPPPEAAEATLSGLAPIDTAALAFGRGSTGSASGGLVALWSDPAAPPQLITPEPLVDAAEASHDIGAMCILGEEHWVAIAQRRTTSDSGQVISTVIAVTTEDAGTTWVEAEVPHPARAGAVIEGCDAAADGTLVTWGVSIGEEGTATWVAHLRDGAAWQPALVDPNDRLTEVAVVDGTLVGFGVSNSEVVGWKVVEDRWIPVNPLGLGAAPRSWATDGDRVVITSLDSNQALVSEASAADLLVEAG
ncbi:MAG: hypothetical protein OES13_09770 [Acidimicrobiia bacterium]|nr:hypothetical protein [Acidimicrobiia bacterium]